MKHIFNLKTIVMCAFLLILFSACTKKNEPEAAKDPSALENSAQAEAEASEKEREVDADETGYAFGVIIAQSVKNDGIKINPDKIMQGFKEASKDNFDAKGFTDAQMVLNQAFQIAHLQKLNKKKEEATKFLEENKTNEGVIVTESGLQYKIIAKGTGTSNPKDGDKVEVNYKGTFTDGSVFDDSSKTGKPVSIDLMRVIPGWKEGLKLMTAGSKYMFYVPPELGYGEQGISQNGMTIIPENAVLIFEVELIRIIEPKIKPEGEE